jgi:hypothetical protein
VVDIGTVVEPLDSEKVSSISCSLKRSSSKVQVITSRCIRSISVNSRDRGQQVELRDGHTVRLQCRVVDPCERSIEQPDASGARRPVSAPSETSRPGELTPRVGEAVTSETRRSFMPHPIGDLEQDLDCGGRIRLGGDIEHVEQVGEAIESVP